MFRINVLKYMNFLFTPGLAWQEVFFKKNESKMVEKSIKLEYVTLFVDTLKLTINIRKITIQTKYYYISCIGM